MRNLLWYQKEKQIQVLRNFQIVVLKIMFSFSPKESEALEVIHQVRHKQGLVKTTVLFWHKPYEPAFVDKVYKRLHLCVEWPLFQIYLLNFFPFSFVFHWGDVSGKKKLLTDWKLVVNLEKRVTFYLRIFKVERSDSGHGVVSQGTTRRFVPVLINMAEKWPLILHAAKCNRVMSRALMFSLFSDKWTNNWVFLAD